MTDTVRAILARDYGLHDLPREWLDHAIAKHKRTIEIAATLCYDSSGVAFMVACEWQRGLTTRACDEMA